MLRGSALHVCICSQGGLAAKCSAAKSCELLDKRDEPVATANTAVRWRLPNTWMLRGGLRGQQHEAQDAGQNGTSDFGTGVQRLTGKSPGRGDAHAFQGQKPLHAKTLRQTGWPGNEPSPWGRADRREDTQKSKEGLINKCSEPIRRGMQRAAGTEAQGTSWLLPPQPDHCCHL